MAAVLNPTIFEPVLECVPLAELECRPRVGLGDLAHDRLCLLRRITHRDREEARFIFVVQLHRRRRDEQARRPFALDAPGDQTLLRLFHRLVDQPTFAQERAHEVVGEITRDAGRFDQDENPVA